MWRNPALLIDLRRAVLVVLSAAMIIAGAAAWAAEDDGTPDPRDLLQALVGIETDIPDDARTAEILGTHREGNGVIIDEDGLVLTIGYLILEASSVNITLQNGRKVAADVVAYDQDSGLGLVRATQALNVDPITLGDSATALENQPALVATRNGISDALGVRVVSRRVFSGSWEYMIEEAIYTSPPHRQFTGAALIGAEGTLIGIGSLFVGNAGGNDRSGNMFVPINELKPILQELVDNGRRSSAPRPWLGVYPEPLRGFVYISRVAEDGPAEAAGVRAGDLVVEVDGVGVGDVEDFYRSIWATGDAGTTIGLTLLSRGGQLREVTVPSIARAEWLRLDPVF